MKAITANRRDDLVTHPSWNGRVLPIWQLRGIMRKHSAQMVTAIYDSSPLLRALLSQRPD